MQLTVLKRQLLGCGDVAKLAGSAIRLMRLAWRGPNMRRKLRRRGIGSDGPLLVHLAAMGLIKSVIATRQKRSFGRWSVQAPLTFDGQPGMTKPSARDISASASCGIPVARAACVKVMALPHLGQIDHLI